MRAWNRNVKELPCEKGDVGRRPLRADRMTNTWLRMALWKLTKSFENICEKIREPHPGPGKPSQLREHGPYSLNSH